MIKFLSTMWVLFAVLAIVLAIATIGTIPIPIVAKLLAFALVMWYAIGIAITYAKD